MVGISLKNGGKQAQDPDAKVAEKAAEQDAKQSRKATKQAERQIQITKIEASTSIKIVTAIRNREVSKAVEILRTTDDPNTHGNSYLDSRALFRLLTYKGPTNDPEKTSTFDATKSLFSPMAYSLGGGHSYTIANGEEQVMASVRSLSQEVLNKAEQQRYYAYMLENKPGNLSDKTADTYRTELKLASLTPPPFLAKTDSAISIGAIASSAVQTLENLANGIRGKVTPQIGTMNAVSADSMISPTYKTEVSVISPTYKSEAVSSSQAVPNNAAAIMVPEVRKEAVVQVPSADNPSAPSAIVTSAPTVNKGAEQTVPKAEASASAKATANDVIAAELGAIALEGAVKSASSKTGTASGVVMEKSVSTAPDPVATPQSVTIEKPPTTTVKQLTEAITQSSVIDRVTAIGNALKYFEEERIGKDLMGKLSKVTGDGDAKDFENRHEANLEIKAIFGQMELIYFAYRGNEAFTKNDKMLAEANEKFESLRERANRMIEWVGDGRREVKDGKSGPRTTPEIEVFSANMYMESISRITQENHKEMVNKDDRTTWSVGTVRIFGEVKTQLAEFGRADVDAEIFFKDPFKKIWRDIINAEDIATPATRVVRQLGDSQAESVSAAPMTTPGVVNAPVASKQSAGTFEPMPMPFGFDLSSLTTSKQLTDAPTTQAAPLTEVARTAIQARQLIETNSSKGNDSAGAVAA